MSARIAVANSPRPKLDVIEVVPLHQLFLEDRGWTRGHAQLRFDDVPRTSPGFLEFGPLRLFAFQSVDPGAAYPMHPHRNAEIITVVLDGSLVHTDSLGQRLLNDAEDVALMSAGRGISHSEAATEHGTCRLLQIWLEPRTREGEPLAEKRSFPRVQRRGCWVTLASGRVGKPREALSIDQDAALCSAVLEAGEGLSFALEPGRRAYLMAVDGSIEVNGWCARPGERVLVRQASQLSVRALGATEVVLLDLP